MALLCYARNMALSDQQLLDPLSRTPFVDSAELAGTLGEPHATVHRVLSDLLADGIAGRVSHGTAHLPSSQRYYLTANGTRHADLTPENSISGKESPPIEWDSQGGLMTRKRYTEEQIIGVLNEAEAGAKTGDLCRKHGMSEATFYKWKAKYAGLTMNELKRLRSLEEENQRLKQIVAQQTLDNWALKEQKTSEAQDEEDGGEICYGESWAEREEGLSTGWHLTLDLPVQVNAG